MRVSDPPPIAPERACLKPPCRLRRRCWQVDYCWIFGEDPGEECQSGNGSAC